MILFLMTFFIIYAGMHLYVFLKAKVALSFGAVVGIPLIIFMVIMTLSPLTVRLSEKWGLESIAQFMFYIGYTWMGILFLFISVSLVIDFYRFFIYISAFISQRNLSVMNPSVRFSFFMPLIFSVIICVYGYCEAKDIRTEMIEIKTSKIPKGVGRLRIVQISDLHLGLIIRKERLKRILDEVKKANPDLLVSTGDLVDGQINRLEGIAELLKEINPLYGKFAVTGNHEFYAGLSQALTFTEKAGFRVLRGEGLSVAGLINIAGVDDPTGKYYGLFRETSEQKLLSGLPRERFTLLLKHRPVVDESAKALFDLQLSGHAHKGQIFPLGLLTHLYYHVDAGYLNLGNDSHLYVSRGIGTWGPPIRFLSPPEVTIIELVHGDRYSLSILN